MWLFRTNATFNNGKERSRAIIKYDSSDIRKRILILSNHYVHTGYHEMRTHRRDSVHVLAVTRAVVLEICS